VNEALVRDTKYELVMLPGTISKMLYNKARKIFEKPKKHEKKTGFSISSAI